MNTLLSGYIRRPDWRGATSRDSLVALRRRLSPVLPLSRPSRGGGDPADQLRDALERRPSGARVNKPMGEFPLLDSRRGGDRIEPAQRIVRWSRHASWQK